MKLWRQDHNIEIYSTHNSGKSVVAERLTGILKNKTYKYINNSVSKILFIDKLDNIVNEYSNTCHRIIEMKSIYLIL